MIHDISLIEELAEFRPHPLILNYRDDKEREIIFKVEGITPKGLVRGSYRYKYGGAIFEELIPISDFILIMS